MYHNKKTVFKRIKCCNLKSPQHLFCVFDHPFPYHNPKPYFLSFLGTYYFKCIDFCNYELPWPRYKFSFCQLNPPLHTHTPNPHFLAFLGGYLCQSSRPCCCAQLIESHRGDTQYRGTCEHPPQAISPQGKHIVTILGGPELRKVEQRDTLGMERNSNIYSCLLQG